MRCPRSPAARGHLLPEVTCCPRSPAAGIHLLPEVTCCRDPPAAGIHLLPGSTCCRDHLLPGSTCCRDPPAAGIHLLPGSTCCRDPPAAGAQKKPLAQYARGFRRSVVSLNNLTKPAFNRFASLFRCATFESKGHDIAWLSGLCASV